MKEYSTPEIFEESIELEDIIAMSISEGDDGDTGIGIKIKSVRDIKVKI